VFTLIVTLSHVIYMKLFTAYGKKEFWYLLVCARIENSLGFRKRLIVSVSRLSGSRWWRSALLGNEIFLLAIIAGRAYIVYNSRSTGIDHASISLCRSPYYRSTTVLFDRGSI